MSGKGASQISEASLSGSSSSGCLVCGVSSFRHEEICSVSFGSIVRCKLCGLVRHWPPRTESQLTELHDNTDYFQHPYFEARRDVQHKGLRIKHRRLLSRLKVLMSRDSVRILDIGCDTGSLLTVARDDFGMDVMGVEVSQAAAETARCENNLDVRVGRLNDLRLPDDRFDLITMIDIIEHVANPLNLLKETNRLLRPGGNLYVATLDHDALLYSIGRGAVRVLNTRAQSMLEKLYIPVHEYYFTKQTLASLVSQAKFCVVRHRNREFPLDEFGHGLMLKLGLVPIFLLQALIGRQTLQELIVQKTSVGDQ